MKKRSFWQFALFVMLIAISVASVLTGCGGKVKNDAVYDTEGNVYAVKANVSDADNRAVLLVNGTFSANDMRGYKIVYTVADASVSAKEKTIFVGESGICSCVPSSPIFR